MLFLLLLNFLSRLRLNLMYRSDQIKIKPDLKQCVSVACAAVIAHKNRFFGSYHQNEYAMFKGKFRQSNDCFKRVLESAKLTSDDENKEVCHLPETWSWWEVVLLIKGKYTILSSFTSPEVLFSEVFSENSNLGRLGSSAPAFCSTANLKLYNFLLTPKLVENFATNPDSF